MERKGGKGYTTADIEALPDGERAELIDGEMFMMATPMTIHQRILVKLIFEIETFIRKNKGNCELLPAPFGVYIKKDDRNYVEPDISVICHEDKLDEKGCHGAPDWVIEIVSPSSRKMDYMRKTALYQETGVREYWIVDPKKEMVTIYEAGRWDIPVCHSFSERIRVGIYKDLYLDFIEFIKN
ncbi:MAG: Uma2 family endonuclease [Lachnospiraceae bacterium]|nr:Uma2 family endonuclease [Lachnospiraceae bacterium]